MKINRNLLFHYLFRGAGPGKKYCFLKRKTDIGFSSDTLMTSSLEIVTQNESTVCVVVGTNWFRMLRPYSNTTYGKNRVCVWLRLMNTVLVRYGTVSVKSRTTGKDCVIGAGVFIKGLRSSKGDEER